MGTCCSSLLRFQRHPKPSIHDPSLPVEPIHVARHTGPAPGPSFNLFAVIIGIDKYADCTALRGAVTDANAVKEYLQEAFGVPEDHILMLLDGQATRAAIIEAFLNLRDDQRIGKGDPILIFFAGHGSELCAPRAWHINGLIQSILPYDYQKSSGGIHPIPDRTIGALIDGIAHKKGDNIIVIFDCCFAAGGTRANEDEEYIPRTQILDPNILVELDDLDQDILEARHGELPEVFSGQGLRSHVLLAASGEAQPAYEHKGRGLFTMALLDILEESVINDVTYVEVVEGIILNLQKPRCVGFNKERVIFNARVSARTREVHYPVQLDNTGSLVVGAGQAHGVSHGVEFTLYSQQRTRLGTIKVDRDAEVKNFYTKATTSKAHVGNSALLVTVTLTRVGEVPFHLGQGWNSSPMATKTLQRMVGDGTSEPSFQFVKDPERARLEVTVEDDQVVFKILDQRTKRFGLTKLPYTATLDSVDHILRAAAHYHWFLHHMNSHFATEPKVDLEFFMLKEDLDEDLQIYRVPDGPGFCRKDSDGLRFVNFVVTPETCYGIEIKNYTTWDLYLNAFLFNSDLSIAFADFGFSSPLTVPYRIQSSRGNPEAPLKHKGSMTIGYGSSEERPFTYWLEMDQDVDVGYLKLFFTTQPIDLTNVLQDSPFGHGGCGENPGGPEARPVENFNFGDAQDIWFTEMIPIIQRRHPNTSLQTPSPPPLDLTTHLIKIGDGCYAGGGFGDVYRCLLQNGSVPEEVAVKAFRFRFMEGDASDRSIKMIQRELGIWQRLNHANIVPFLGIAYGFGMNGSLSLVSLWMPNGSLHNFLTEHEHLDVIQRLQFLLEISNGLHYLHSFQIVHGDLNCHNVLVDADHTARLVDFGNSSLIGHVPQALSYLRRSTAQPGALRWSAPEQVNPVDSVTCTTESDIYSFGCVALQVLSGKEPWSEVREQSVVLRLANGHNPGRPVSRAIEDSHWDFIQCCWSRIEQRPTAEMVMSKMKSLSRLAPSRPFEDYGVCTSGQEDSTMDESSSSLSRQ